MHYASIPIEKGQLEFWARLIPLPPFWSSLIISDKIFGNCQLRSFTFEWYLGTSWTQSSSEAKINCSSSSLQTGCEWNVGTSWTLASKECIKYFGHEKNSQNICIFQIPFSQWWVPQTKKLFSDVFWAHINLLVCKISSWSDMPNRFFANQCHIFHKYLTGIFFPESFESFWPARSGIFKIGSKLSKY